MARELGGFDPKATYSAAAEDYERASRQYWKFLSTRTLERLDVRPGQQVLDVACGTGSASIAAARRVGPRGRVVGIDYADGMLQVARREVRTSGLANIELVQGDMMALPYADEFDVVLCVLGLFFIDDMTAAARALWSHVRPGGTLAVTTFGADVWTPVLQPFIDEAQRARPDIELIVPWRRAEDPAVLARTCRDAGIPDVRVAQEIAEIPFRAEDWRSIVMGSGLRRIADALGPDAGAVIAATEAWARARSVSSVRVSMNVATAIRPGPGSIAPGRSDQSVEHADEARGVDGLQQVGVEPRRL